MIGLFFAGPVQLRFRRVWCCSLKTGLLRVVEDQEPHRSHQNSAVKAVVGMCRFAYRPSILLRTLSCRCSCPLSRSHILRFGHCPRLRLRRMVRKRPPYSRADVTARPVFGPRPRRLASWHSCHQPLSLAPIVAGHSPSLGVRKFGVIPPELDQSWMDTPIPRAKFANWLP